MQQRQRQQGHADADDCPEHDPADMASPAPASEQLRFTIDDLCSEADNEAR